MTDDVRVGEEFSAVYTVTAVDLASGWVTVGNLDATTVIPVLMLGDEVRLGRQVLLTVVAGDVTVELLT